MLLRLILTIILFTFISSTHSASIDAYKSFKHDQNQLTIPENTEFEPEPKPEAFESLNSKILSKTQPSVNQQRILSITDDTLLAPTILNSAIYQKQYTSNSDVARHSYELLSKVLDERKLTHTLVILEETKGMLESTDQIIQNTFAEFQIINTLSTLNAGASNLSNQKTNSNFQESNLNNQEVSEIYRSEDTPQHMQQVTSLLSMENILIVIFIFIFASAIYRIASFVLLRNPYK